MEHYSNEELIEMIGLDAPILADKNITKSKKALAIVGRLIMLSSLEENKKTGYVYRSNADLAADVDTDESTLRRLLKILENRGYVERRAGNRADNRASIYYLNWNKVNDVVPPYVQNSSTPSATPLSTPSATPLSTPSVEEVLNALSLEIKEIKETLKRLEEMVTTPSATPSATPSSEKLPPPVIDIVIDKEIDINKEMEYNIKKDGINIIEENEIKDNGKLIERNDIMKNGTDLLKLWDKVYKEDTSTIDGTIKYITDDLTTRWLHRVNKWEYLEHNLNCAKMAARTTSNYPELKQFTTEEQQQIINQVITNLENSANKRIQRMKEKQALSAKTKPSTEEIYIPAEQQPASAFDTNLTEDDIKALNANAAEVCKSLNKNFRTEPELNDALQHLMYLLDKNEKEWTDEGYNCNKYFSYLREYATNVANEQRKQINNDLPF